MTQTTDLTALNDDTEILLANPRGFCAGVERAIEIVERALAQFGAPIYVRHEIVHNKFVVDDLRAKGAVFVADLDEVPAGNTVIFSAHGVSQDVRREADSRGLRVFDATCPLVTKVHMEAGRHHADGFHIVLIGHRGHPEVIGTMGQLPAGATSLVETVEDAEKVAVPDPGKVAYATQTTLAVDDTRDIIAVLNGAMVRVLQMPDIVKRLAGLGFEPIAGTPDDCAAHIREALAKWARVVAQAKIRVE